MIPNKEKYFYPSFLTTGLQQEVPDTDQEGKSEGNEVRVRGDVERIVQVLGCGLDLAAGRECLSQTVQCGDQPALVVNLAVDRETLPIAVFGCPGRGRHVLAHEGNRP